MPTSARPAALTNRTRPSKSAIAIMSVLFSISATNVFACSSATARCASSRCSDSNSFAFAIAIAACSLSMRANARSYSPNSGVPGSNRNSETAPIVRPRTSSGTDKKLRMPSVRTACENAGSARAASSTGSIVGIKTGLPVASTRAAWPVPLRPLSSASAACNSAITLGSRAHAAFGCTHVPSSCASETTHASPISSVSLRATVPTKPA